MDRLVDILIGFYGPTPYFAIFGILLACGLGLPIPEDITLFAAGVLAYYGICDIGWIIAVGFFGVMCGDFIIFWLGHHFGRKLTSHGLFKRLLPEDRLNMVQERFKQKGNKLVFAARFMPGLRAPIFFSAGTLHLPYRVFLFYDGMAALISVPLIIGAVYYFGDYMDKVVRIIQRLEHGIVLVIFLAVFAILGKWYVTHRKLKGERRRELATAKEN